MRYVQDIGKENEGWKLTRFHSLIADNQHTHLSWRAVGNIADVRHRLIISTFITTFHVYIDYS